MSVFWERGFVDLGRAKGLKPEGFFSLPPLEIISQGRKEEGENRKEKQRENEKEESYGFQERRYQAPRTAVGWNGYLINVGGCDQTQPWINVPMF